MYIGVVGVSGEFCIAHTICNPIPVKRCRLARYLAKCVRVNCLRCTNGVITYGLGTTSVIGASACCSCSGGVKCQGICDLVSTRCISAYVDSPSSACSRSVFRRIVVRKIGFKCIRFRQGCISVVYFRLHGGRYVYGSVSLKRPSSRKIARSRNRYTLQGKGLLVTQLLPMLSRPYKLSLAIYNHISRLGGISRAVVQVYLGLCASLTDCGYGNSHECHRTRQAKHICSYIYSLVQLRVILSDLCSIDIYRQCLQLCLLDTSFINVLHLVIQVAYRCVHSRNLSFDCGVAAFKAINARIRLRQFSIKTIHF